MATLFDVVGAVTRRSKRAVFTYSDVDAAYTSGDVITFGGAPTEVVCAGLEPNSLVSIHSIKIREKAYTGAAQSLAVRFRFFSETFALAAQDAAFVMPTGGVYHGKVDIPSASYEAIVGSDAKNWAFAQTATNLDFHIPTSAGGRSFWFALCANESGKTIAASAMFEIEIIYSQDVW